MKFQGTNITMVRGTTDSITIKLSDENDNQVNFTTGDVIYFTVKESPNSTVDTLQIEVDTFINGQAIISLLPEHTKDLSFKDYRYDIRFIKSDGTVRNIVNDSKFTVGTNITSEVSNNG